MKLTKANVSRFLKAQGEVRACYHTSGQVRGYGHWSAGFRVQDGPDAQHPVRVLYQKSYHGRDPKVITAALQRWAGLLSQHWTVGFGNGCLLLSEGVPTLVQSNA